MKKVIKYLFIFIVIIFINITSVYARAGGGHSSSGGSSGGYSSGGSSSHTAGRGSRESSTSPFFSIISIIMSGLSLVVITSSSAILIEYKITKAKIKTRRKFKATTWKYKEVEQRVMNAYFTIEKSWAKGDMSNAKSYMDQYLYNRFVIKLNWQEMQHKKNILKRISLIDAAPIALSDDEDNSKDFLWVYIHGRMVDYTIDTETNKKIEGSYQTTSFIEFWQFRKNDKEEWVLCKIFQKEEFDKIPIES